MFNGSFHAEQAKYLVFKEQCCAGGHSHRYNELNFILAGSHTFQFEDLRQDALTKARIELTLHPGEVLVVPAGVAHRGFHPANSMIIAFTTYGNASESHASAQIIPVHLSLGESTLLQVAQRNGQLEFYKTSSGYATLGNKSYVAGTGGSYEVSFSDHYMGITPEEAVAHAGGDWQVIYKAALKQARVIPDSVWPSLVRETFCPECPVPDGGVVELRVEDGRVKGPVQGMFDTLANSDPSIGDLSRLNLPSAVNEEIERERRVADMNARLAIVGKIDRVIEELRRLEELKAQEPLSK
jgi:mannose-6-phosphate isomerase-like protein (cupin superfamily)